MSKASDSAEHAKPDGNKDVGSLNVVILQQPRKTPQDKKGSKGAQGKATNKKATTGPRPEAVPRLHHLYKAAHLVSAGPGGQVGRVLSAHYTGLVVGVSQKSVLRLTPEVKRTICKGCRCLLLPGKLRFVKQSGGHIEVRCPRCSAVKNFPLKKKKKQ